MTNGISSFTVKVNITYDTGKLTEAFVNTCLEITYVIYRHKHVYIQGALIFGFNCVSRRHSTLVSEKLYKEAIELISKVNF